MDDAHARMCLSAPDQGPAASPGMGARLASLLRVGCAEVWSLLWQFPGNKCARQPRVGSETPRARDNGPARRGDPIRIWEALSAETARRCGVADEGANPQEAPGQEI